VALHTAWSLLVEGVEHRRHPVPCLVVQRGRASSARHSTAAQQAPSARPARLQLAADARTLTRYSRTSASATRLACGVAISTLFSLFHGELKLNGSCAPQHPISVICPAQLSSIPSSAPSGYHTREATQARSSAVRARPAAWACASAAASGPRRARSGAASPGARCWAGRVRMLFVQKSSSRFLWCAGSSPWRMGAVCGWRMRARVGGLVPS
jgi:hypothetical protein